MRNATPLLDLPTEVVVDLGNDALIARITECLAHPLAESFRESIDRLASIATGIGGRVRIGMDFAPLSFGFAVIRSDGNAWICGGIIFHGPHDRGGAGGSPTYSVCVQPVEGWTLHT